MTNHNDYQTKTEQPLPAQEVRISNEELMYIILELILAIPLVITFFIFSVIIV